MIVQTSRFGEIEINEADVIRVTDGLIGFSELIRFVLLDHEPDSPFKWLQSIDDGSVAFVIMNPLNFRPDYVVEVTEEEIASLKIENMEDAVISSIVTIPSDPKRMSANLKAPLIFNLANRLGKQLILKDPEYQTKHFILDEMKKYAHKDAQAQAKKAAQTSSQELAQETDDDRANEG